MEREPFRRYGMAVLTTAVALVFWKAVVKEFGPSPYPLFLLAVTVSSWYGGREPGLLAIALSLALAAVAYDQPDTTRHMLQLGLFLLLAIPVCWLNHERLQLLQRERDARERVEHLAAERAAILMVDAAGQITYVNDAARLLLGIDDLEHMTLAALAGTLHISRLDGTRISGDDTFLARALHGDTVNGEDRAIQRPDGRRLVIRVNAACVTERDGAVLGAVAAIRDVTAERTLEEQRATLIAGVAHDLKNPLTSIKGTAQLLRRKAARVEVPGAPEWEEMCTGLCEIEAGANRTVTLINEFLQAGDRSTRKLTPRVEHPVDLAAMTRKEARAHQQTTDDHVIRVECAAPEIIGMWDETRLERIVGNLLSNAIKYSPHGGEIVVTVARDGDGADSRAVLVVADHGMGIPPGDRERIFDQFHRGSNVPGGIPGTGIGLAATRQLIQQCGGEIAVTSEEGHGTTFTVQLPLASPRAAVGASEAAARTTR